MDFTFEKDGWAHIMPFGEFPHAEAGVIQVIDTEALEAIEDNFTAKSKAQNFPGLLVDFDHFSMDTDKPSEAAGWIIALRIDADGLWAKVRWTAKGEAAVTGGEYRLVSPVFPKPSRCEDLGNNRIRPRELLSVALTNEPNIKGARPLTNRAPEPSAQTANRWSAKAREAARAARKAKNEARKAEARAQLRLREQERRENRYTLRNLPVPRQSKATSPLRNTGENVTDARYYIDGAWYDNAGNFLRRDRPAGCLRNRPGDERLYKWVLGKTKSGKHCSDCAARAGKIKTIAEWRAMGSPNCPCKCTLTPV